MKIDDLVNLLLKTDKTIYNLIQRRFTIDVIVDFLVIIICISTIFVFRLEGICKIIYIMCSIELTLDILYGLFIKRKSLKIKLKK